MIQSAILWRRLDVPGHDACRLVQTPEGWRIEGTALFLHEGTPARLDYQLHCDTGWVSRRGVVQGWVGDRAVDHLVVHTAERGWVCNGAAVAGVDGCFDLDLGFTPATNLAQLRRLALADGQAADVPVAWLDVASGQVELLRQRYERRSGTTYWYEAPRFEYQALLEVNLAGFVERYPELWQAEG